MSYVFATVGDIVDQALNETLGSATSTLTVLQDSSLIRQVDRINRDFLRAARTKGTNEQWSWMDEGRDEFETYDATALSDSADEGDADFDVDSVTGFPTGGGRVWMDTVNDAVEFVDYESIASLTITVSTATDAETIGIDHDSGDHVELLYALPPDFKKIIDVFVDGKEYDPYEAESLPPGGHYRIVDNYILFPQDIGTTDVVIRYEKGPSALSTGDDATDRARSTQIPVDFDRYAVEKLVAFIQTKRRKEEAAANAFVLAEQALMDALADDINESSDYIY